MVDVGWPRLRSYFGRRRNYRGGLPDPGREQAGARWASGVGHRAGTLVWTQRGTGEKVGAVSYEILNNGPNDVRLRLTYTHRGRVKDGRTDESVWFDTSHPHFGGVRWWFTCPRCGRRAAKLHLPPGEISSSAGVAGG